MRVTNVINHRVRSQSVIINRSVAFVPFARLPLNGLSSVRGFPFECFCESCSTDNELIRSLNSFKKSPLKQEHFLKLSRILTHGSLISTIRSCCSLTTAAFDVLHARYSISYLALSACSSLSSEFREEVSAFAILP